MTAISALSTPATRPAVPAAARAAATVPRRPLLAPVRLHARAASRARPAKLACRAEQGRGGGAGGEPEDLESQSFQSLASLVANQIAEAYKGRDVTKLASWLSEVASMAGDDAQKAADAAGGAAKDAGASSGGGVTGALKKAASVAAAVLGAQGPTGGHQESKAWEAAAHYLGADSLALTPDALKGWITAPKRKDDVKVVAALVLSMLKYFEKQTGESFEGKDHQYSFLWHLAQELFGGSMSMRLVKSLVKAYLHVIPTR